MASLITNLFSPKKPKIEAPPPPAKPSTKEVETAGEDEAALRKRRGRGQTILTGSGLLDGTAGTSTTEPSISRAKLGNSS